MRQLIVVFGQIILLPIYLKYWGGQVYGEWQLLSAAVAYIVLLDFGMQTYAVNRLNQSYARGEAAECRRVFHTALSISLIVAVSATIILLLSVWSVPAEKWFHLRSTSSGRAQLVILVLGLHVAWSLPAGVVGGIYRAVGELARDLLFNNIQRGTVLAITAIALVKGADMLVIAFIQFAGLAAHAAFVQWDLRRRHPDIPIGLSGRDWRLGLAFLAPSFLFLMMQFSAAFLVQGTTLLVGAFAGATAVAAFVAIRTLANAIAQGTQALGAVLWPELSAIESRREYSKLRVIYLLASKLLFSFSLALGIFLHFSAPDIVRWWTGGRIQYDSSMMSALIAIQVCQSWYLASSVVLGSSNNHRRLALTCLATSVLGLAIGAFLGLRVGAAGILWGLAIAEVVLPCWVVPLLACRLIGQDVWHYVRDVLGKGAIFACLSYVVVSSVRIVQTDTGGIERTFGTGFIVAVLATLFLFAFWLSHEQRRTAMSALRLPSSRV